MAEVVATETTANPPRRRPRRRRPATPGWCTGVRSSGCSSAPRSAPCIGTTAIWVFFWAVAPIFGTAAGTANYLDVAATLGIMAVAVSLLMIGGEFDLSSGAMTGATAMLVILLSKAARRVRRAPGSRSRSRCRSRSPSP